jgi:hypothetical protein
MKDKTFLLLVALMMYAPKINTRHKLMQNILERGISYPTGSDKKLKPA